MRTKTSVALAVALPLLVAGLTACSSSTSKVTCKNERCEASIQTATKTKKKILKYDVTFRDLQDDKATVQVGRDSRTLKEGEKATIGNLSVECVDADKGEAAFVITRA